MALTTKFTATDNSFNLQVLTHKLLWRPATSSWNIKVERVPWKGKKCTLLGYYTACSGNFLRTFWDNLSVPSSSPSNPLKMGLIHCPKTSVINYYYSLCNNTDGTVLISFTAEALNKVCNSKFRMNKRLHKLFKSVCFCTGPWWRLAHPVRNT